jgi:ubiquinone/menaquinone biosynthesis C-methylase UbiE
MNESYNLAFKEIANTLMDGGHCLDCGANTGSSFSRINKSINLDNSRYHGIEWNKAAVHQAQLKGLNVIQGDLNRKLPFENGQFRCVFGLSLLEHLLNGCAFMKECHRVLENSGKLILLTPNISTFFTIALLLIGKMPSSGPYPDSNALLAKEEIFKVSDDNIIHDTESETPVHRHLVVFSYRVLRQYLSMIGFSEVQGYGFGLYPFPTFMQPVLEKFDPYHCHQMVFGARK